MTDLILALDVTEKKSALSIAHECAPHLDAIKVGYPLILSAGLSVAQELKPKISRLSLISKSPTSQTRIVSSQSRFSMPGSHPLSVMGSPEKMQSRHVSTPRLIMGARVLLSLR